MSYDYLEPASTAEAVDLLAEHGDDAVVLAGGTAFAIMLRQGLIEPRVVVGLRRLAGLRDIRSRDDGLWIGALATHRDVERSPLVRGHHHMIADAFAQIATVRIRNQATVGGNLAHADPSQDPPPILMAFDARVAIVGPAGARRQVALGDLFVDHLTTTLAPTELIEAVIVPPALPGTRAIHLKFAPRSAEDWATVSVAAAVALDADGRVAWVRVALGAVGSTPIRAHQVEAALVGQAPTRELLREAAALVRGEVDPLDDLRGSASYKREMARVWTERALAQVSGPWASGPRVSGAA